MTLFPSVMEGSSIAFLEAMHLSRNVIAYDAPHFTRMPVNSPQLAQLHLVGTRKIEDWARTLRQVAASLDEQTCG